MKTLALLLLLCPAVFAQAASDIRATASQGPGNLLRTIPFAPVVMCLYPPSGGVPCTNLAVTYTDPTLATQCPSSSPVVIPGTSSCSATSDSGGNFQFYVNPASASAYSYYFRAGATWEGPYTITASGNVINNNSPLGFQVLPPALPEIDIAVDPTGACPYPTSILTAGQAHIAALPNATLCLNFGIPGIGAQQIVAIRFPSVPVTVGSVIQYTSRNNLEIVPQPWAYMLNAYCTGTVGTGNATTYILTPGSNGTTCTLTTAAEMPMPAPCTAQKLYSNSSAGGAVAGSGVMTLYKNGSATALTCTMGTGTTCNDQTDTAPFNAGDTWSVRVTTGQATDTTANARAGFLCQ